MKKLGVLEQAELRTCWNKEVNFTRWLAEEENLKLLSDEIGIEIVLKEIEASVGRFNVDILAREEDSDRLIIIENQLEQTDHDHLGKLITYTSGYNAEVIIWIFKEMRDEHKNAIDWMNEHTNDKINFFAIKIELWKIENSLIAPKFQIISKPNNWAKILQNSSQTRYETEASLKKKNFWEEFVKYMQERTTILTIKKRENAQQWFSINLGTSKFTIRLSIASSKNEISTGIRIHDDKNLYNQLEEKKEDIEKKLETNLIWISKEDNKVSYILLKKENVDILNVGCWPEYFEWLKVQSESLYKAFQKYI